MTDSSVGCEDCHSIHSAVSQKHQHNCHCHHHHHLHYKACQDLLQLQHHKTELFQHCGHAITQMVMSQLTAKVQVQSQACAYETCDEQSGTGTGFFACTSVIPCQYRTICTPYLFIHLSLVLFNLSN